MFSHPKFLWAVFCLSVAGLAFGFQQESTMGKADEKAAALAAKTMEAMGGEANYDATRYLSWTFFGRRDHIWDKWTGDYRMEDKEGNLVIMNINTQEGKAWANGEPVTDPEALKAALKRGYEVWINDSYWLVMPYKLRDPGVTLTYVKEGQTTDGKTADVLALTFDGVGVTPQNKYDVYVDRESGLITQWDFYTKADDPEPRFQIPWHDWKPFGKIMLSGNRGRAQLDNIGVHQTIPEHTFKTGDPVVFE